MSSTTRATRVRGRRAGLAQVVVLLAAACMPVMAATLITPVIPAMKTHFAEQLPAAAVEGLVPLLVALPALMVAVFAPFAGQIVDRVGRRNLLIIALFAYAALGVVPAFLDGFVAMLLSRLVLGVCESAIMTVATALIVDYFHDEQKRNRYLGLQAAASAIAATVFIVIGTVLMTVTWQAPFWVYLISLLIAVPAIFLLWEPEETERVAQAERGRIPWRGLGGPLVATVVGGFTFYTLVIHLPSTVAQVGRLADSAPAVGGLAALASVAVALGGVVFPAVKRRLGDRIVPLAFLLQAVGQLFIWGLSGVAGVMGVAVGAVVASFGSGLLLPGFLTWVVTRTSFAQRGRVTGLWTGAFFLGNFLAAPVIGQLGGALSGPGANGFPVAIGFVGILAALFAVVTWFSSRRSSATETPLGTPEAATANP